MKKQTEIFRPDPTSSQLTDYQRGVVRQWALAAHKEGEDRENAIAHVLCSFHTEQEQAVRAIFDWVWPKL